MTMDRTMISKLPPGKVVGWLLVASVILMFNGCVHPVQNDDNTFAGNRLLQPMDTKAYRFPANTTSQIRQHIQCKGTMLMIPLALADWPRENKVAVLENPYCH